MEILQSEKQMKQKWERGYKLFECDEHGVLYPLFIGKKNPVPEMEVLKAEYLPTKNFAPHAGWHICADFPSAPWLLSADGTYKSQRKKTWSRVWCEIEYLADNDVTEEAEKLPKKYIEGPCPEDSFYYLRKNQSRLWVIADKIRINRIIPEPERLLILSELGFDEKKAMEPYLTAMQKRMKKKEGKN